MANLHEDLENCVNESLPFLFEKLGDLSQLKKHRCFTLAQCALLLCMHNNIEKPDRTEDAATFIMLALKDVARGKLQVLHPETLLPWSEYLEMIKAGMYGKDSPLYAPAVTAGWLVHIDEAEKWYRSKGIEIDLSHIKQEINTIETLVQRESQIHKEEFQRIASSRWKNNPNLTQTEIIDSDEMEFYRRGYRGKNTLRDWIREIDPRPKESRRGRPKKYPPA